MQRPARSTPALAAVLLLIAAAGARPAGAGAAPGPDPGLSKQWGLTQIRAPEAWATATGQGSTIAIVDSGIDLNHEDFQRANGTKVVVGDIECLGTTGDPRQCDNRGRDDNGHGTHVAGIAAAARGNGRGVAGVAPGARLLAVRVLENNCTGEQCQASGSLDDVVAGIRWAATHGADVINLSLGEVSQSVFGPAFEEAINEAWSLGAIPVVATGNDVVLPSGFSDEPAVVVAATNRDDRIASYSNGVGGAQWAISAPGGEPPPPPDFDDCGSQQPSGVLSTWWEDGRHDLYSCEAGTSMAAPHVSGALAILRGMGLNPDQTVRHLLATADDLGPNGRDSTYGSGRVNLARAVSEVVAGRIAPPPPGPGTAAPPPPPVGSGPGAGGPEDPGQPVPATASTIDLPDRPSGTAQSSSTTTTEPPSSEGKKKRGPGGTSSAAPRNPTDFDSDGDDRPPAALVLLAVVLIAGTTAGTAWHWYTRPTGARRTHARVAG